MRIKNYYSILHSILVIALWCVFFLFAIFYAYADEKNKLVDFKAFGQWEIWCIDIAQVGDIHCNLNQVLRYKNHPDFRAMIPRFFTDGKQLTRLEIDREWQTGFSRGYIQVDDFEPVSLKTCGKPCILEGTTLEKLVDQFIKGKKASIHFHDYLVEEFNVEISLSEFKQAVETLKLMQP